MSVRVISARFDVSSAMWAVLAAGFWLSFGAVALIFIVSIEKDSPAKQWIQVQWAITIGLAVVWRWVFPALAEIDRLEEITPSTAGAREVLVVGRGPPASTPEPAD